jgi:hypothetical protein
MNKDKYYKTKTKTKTKRTRKIKKRRSKKSFKRNLRKSSRELKSRTKKYKQKGGSNAFDGAMTGTAIGGIGSYLGDIDPEIAVGSSALAGLVGGLGADIIKFKNKKKRIDGLDELERVVDPMFVLPGYSRGAWGIDGRSNKAIFKTVPVKPERYFGNFQEKTIVCNRDARMAIDWVCRQGGFTQKWAKRMMIGPNDEKLFMMEKIPVMILVIISLNFPDWPAWKSIIGAYSICMDPDVRTCMNVIKGRRKSSNGKFVVDKFSLYYPDNSAILDRGISPSGNLIQGWAFRTAVFSGTLGQKRKKLKNLSKVFPEGRNYGLIIDRDSAYEDTAYVKNSDDDERKQMENIGAMITRMVEMLGDIESGEDGEDNYFAMSYDPDEADRGITVLQSEWYVFNQAIADTRFAARMAAANLD